MILMTKRHSEPGMGSHDIGLVRFEYLLLNANRKVINQKCIHKQHTNILPRGRYWNYM